jgi:hypothetical protein
MRMKNGSICLKISRTMVNRLYMQKAGFE